MEARGLVNSVAAVRLAQTLQPQALEFRSVFAFSPPASSVPLSLGGGGGGVDTLRAVGG